MNYPLIPAAIVLFAGVLSTHVAMAAKGVQVKVVGQNNPLVDRQAIQDAIDSAPGQALTVKLRGVFQLDGTDLVVERSDLTIKGENQGASLKGLLDPEGRPIDDIDNFPNRGLRIEANAPLQNIKVANLAFSGLRTAVFVRGPAASVHGVTIENNRVENSFNGVSLGGEVSDIKIADNAMHDISSNAVTVFGGPLSDVKIEQNSVSVMSTGVWLQSFSGPVSGVKIEDNYLENAREQAILLIDVEGAIVENNFLSTVAASANDLPAPFVAFGTNTAILVEGNELQGGFAGALLFGSASGFTVTGNCIRDGGTQGWSAFRSGGILVGWFGAASGFEITDNAYQGNLAGFPALPRDVWLASDSRDTSVTERSGTTVVDDGVSNSVVVLPGDGINYCND